MLLQIMFIIHLIKKFVKKKQDEKKEIFIE
jgi:hypothetical protein